MPSLKVYTSKPPQNFQFLTLPCTRDLYVTVQSFCWKGSYAYQGLSNAFHAIKRYKEINKAVDYLINAKKVYILGMRSSFSVAFYLHYLLHFTLPAAELIRGQEGMLLSEISQINSNDVVLVFGASPLSLETTKALDKIKKKSAFIIVATDMYTSQATSHADIVIALGNETMNFFPSLLTLHSIFRNTSLSVGRKGRQKNAEPYQKI